MDKKIYCNCKFCNFVFSYFFTFLIGFQFKFNFNFNRILREDESTHFLIDICDTQLGTSLILTLFLFLNDHKHLRNTIKTRLLFTGIIK